MRSAIRAFIASPYTYVIGFALIGAVSITAGIEALFGMGYALLSAGVFLLLAAAFISKGLNG